MPIIIKEQVVEPIIIKEQVVVPIIKEQVVDDTNDIQTLVGKFNISFDLLNEKIMNNIDDGNEEILEIFIKTFGL